MKQRPLGRTGFQVSEVGLGCWQFGGDFGPIAGDTVHEIIDAALTSGINFFDTADVYGAGRSERFLGEAFGGQEGKGPVIATKYGRGPETYPDQYFLDNLRDAVKRAQDRLQTNSIDLLQLHCIPTEVMAQGEIFDCLRTVQQEGHIKHFGASVETVEEALTCAKQDDLASLQVIFNIFRQKLIDELFPVVKEKGIGVIVRLPLASGLLSGKYSPDTAFAPTDHRNYNRNGEAFSVGETFAGIPFATGLQLVDELKAEVPQGMSMAQMAMRWILDHDAVSTIIPGASSAQQAKENARVSELAPLSPELHQRLGEFYQSRVKQHIRGAY